MRYRHTPPVPNPARAPCPRGQARQAGVGIGSGLYRILLLPLLLSAPRADPFVQPAFCLINFTLVWSARVQPKHPRVHQHRG